MEMFNPNCLDDNSYFPVGMAYVPMQNFRKLYESDVAFERGTIFEELDLPFIGEEAVKNGR